MENTSKSADLASSLEKLARKATKEKQWSSALRYWEKLLEAHPKRFSALNGKAKSLLRLKQFGQSEQAFHDLVKRYPGKIQGFYGLLQVAIRSHQLELALERCSVLQEKFPEHIPSYIQKGTILLSLKRLEEAEEVFTYLTKQSPPHDVRGVSGLAKIAKLRDQSTIVLDCSRVLPEQSPQYLPEYVSQGNVLIELNRLSEAKAVFTYLTELYPNKAQGLRGLMKVAARSRQWQVALEHSEYLEDNFPYHVLNHSIKGNALLSLEKFDEAEEYFTYLAQEYPDENIGLYGLCRLADHMHRWHCLLQRCKHLQEQFPDFLPGYVLEGKALVSLCQFLAAEIVFTRMLEHYPDEPEGLCGLARIAFQQQQWKLALQRLDAVTEKFPQSKEGHLRKADVLMRLEEFHFADRELRLLNDLYPNQLSILIRLVDVASSTQEWSFIVGLIKAYIYCNAHICPNFDHEGALTRLINHLVIHLIESGRFLDLEEILESLLSCSVNPGFLCLWKSQVLWAKNESSIARQICLDALQQYPKVAEQAQLQLAKYALQDFNIKEALSYCNQIKPSTTATFAAAASLCCFALIRLDDIESAKQKLQEIIHWHPSNIRGYVLLSEILCFHDKDYISTINLCSQGIAYNTADERLYCYKALAQSALGKTDEALQFLAEYSNHHYDSRLVDMAQAQVFRLHGDYQKSLQMVNKWLTAGNFLPIQSTGEHCEFNVQYLQCSPSYRVDSDEVVSIIMTTYRRDMLLPIAISSILNQTYRNIELIIVDDCSPDDNFDFLQEIAATDERVQVVRNQQNVGTYVSKNNGIAISSGQYIAFMDSDDWLHPQTIERQVETLQDPKTLAVMCGFFRVDEESCIEFKPEGPNRQAHITLCFKRSPIFETIGYFDAVRTGADTEHLERISQVFGSNTIKRIKYPLLISTRHSRSITGGSSALGFSWYGPGPNDSLYASAFRAWHKRLRIEDADPYLSHPLQQRTFEAPQALLA